jgi:hypothetical protein
MSACILERNYLKIKTIAHFAISVLSLFLSQLIGRHTNYMHDTQTENNRSEYHLGKAQLPPPCLDCSTAPFCFSFAQGPSIIKTFNKREEVYCENLGPKFADISFE